MGSTLSGEHPSPSAAGLTTVGQDFQRVGRAAVQLLVAQLSSGARMAERVIIDSELVCRHSSAMSSTV